MRLEPGLLERGQDSVKDGVQVAQHITVAKPQHSVPVGFEEASPVGVLVQLVVVHAAVEFDNKPRRRAAEIEDERANRVLPTELGLRVPTIPQRSP